MWHISQHLVNGWNRSISKLVIWLDFRSQSLTARSRLTFEGRKSTDLAFGVCAGLSPQLLCRVKRSHRNEFPWSLEPQCFADEVFNTSLRNSQSYPISHGPETPHDILDVKRMKGSFIILKNLIESTWYILVPFSSAHDTAHTHNKLYISFASLKFTAWQAELQNY